MTVEVPKLEDICKMYDNTVNSKDWDSILSVRESINTWVKRRFGVKNIEVFENSMLYYRVIFRKKINGTTLEGRLIFNFSTDRHPPYIFIKIFVLLGSKDVFYFSIERHVLQMTDIRINDALKRRYNYYYNDYEEFLLHIREQLTNNTHYSHLHLKNTVRERTRRFKAIYDSMKNIGVI